MNNNRLVVRALFHSVLGKRLAVWCATVWTAAGLSGSLWAQGTELTVLRTGGTDVLVTATESLPAFTGTSPPVLAFDFGFETDEVFAPDRFFDSITATLQTLDGQNTAVLFVIDAGGLVLAPATPGTLPLDAESFRLSAVLFRPLTPTLQNQAGFHLAFPLPSEFASEPANLIFDLFDNQNQEASLGWFRYVVVVPEPTTWMLAILAGVICGLRGKWVARSKLDFIHFAMSRNFNKIRMIRHSATGFLTCQGFNRRARNQKALETGPVPEIYGFQNGQSRAKR